MSGKTSNVTWTPNPTKAKILNGAKRGLLKATQRIEAAAKAQLKPGHGKRTGTLQRDIQAREPEERNGRLVGIVGTGAASRKYALFVHQGGGMLIAKKGEVFKILMPNGDIIYRKRRKQRKAIPFMTDGYQQVKSLLANDVQQAIKAEL